jgi:hypothetical protein
MTIATFAISSTWDANSAVRISLKQSGMPENYKVWFFAGGETRDDRFNTFTGSFIRLMKMILGDDFDFVKGIFKRSAAGNVLWALNNAQKPDPDPASKKIFTTAFRQITDSVSPETRLTIISSSTGSVVAAQTACYIAMENRNRKYLNKPFHLVLGASMISPQSDLYKQLIKYQKDGIIGTILHDEVQDEGDNSFGVGGSSRTEAYRNAFGLMVPLLSAKYNGPSFLNTNPDSGHIHRKRSNTVQKALDYINTILVEHRLAGDLYMQKAIDVLSREVL